MALTDKQKELKELCEKDLVAFVGLVAPERVLGHCHMDLLHMLQEDDPYQLIIWPRGHQKSTMVAFWCAWKIINQPDVTILYTSATGSLAEKQINYIKQLLAGKTVQKYWPDLLHRDENKRSLWRNMEFEVDHPQRALMGVRDPTVKAVGLGGNVTGFHADVIILDDLVVKENAYTKAGRESVESDYSLFNSVLNPGGIVKAVGTRYHPEDLYNKLSTMERVEETVDGVREKAELVYRTVQEVVEVDGNFLWPRQQRPDGKWFGFNRPVLNGIKSNYLDKTQFYAQYYNDPSDPFNKRISNFNYYEPKHLLSLEGKWYLGDRRLNVYAAIDFAASMAKRADYTAIAVIGVDADTNIYVLDLDRFKTDKPSEQAAHLRAMYNKWRFLKLHAEVNAQQKLAVSAIKEWNRKENVFYSIVEKSQDMNKELRIMAVLEPRYAAGVVYHQRGGNWELLEAELGSTKPAHDDLSDALASAVEIMQPPLRATQARTHSITFNKRFGGVL